MDPTPYNPWATPIFPGASAFGVGSPAEAAERQPTIVDNILSHIAGALGLVAPIFANAVGENKQ